MTQCRICKKSPVLELLDFGKQPVSNRFLTSKHNEEFKHSLILGLCKSCGLVQLINPFPASELKPIYDWVTYNEPEEHLDNLADILAKSNMDKDAKICGISFKDDSLLERLKKKGFEKVMRLDPKKDLRSDNASGGVETVQNLLNKECAKNIAKNYGKFDLVLVRHVLEHTYDIAEFTAAIKELMNPDSFVMFEVPDTTKPLEHYDYSTIWEEHIVYFTPETFKNCFSYYGFKLEKFNLYPYSLENSLVGICKISEDTSQILPDDRELQKENDRAMAFSNKFPKIKRLIKSFFSDHHKNNGKITVFGAGHTACMIINIFELKDYIGCVIDDNPNKKGLFMPASHIPIKGSSIFLEEDIKLSIFSLNPGIEGKIIEKNNTFMKRGGIFLSFCPLSRISIYNNLGNDNNLKFKEINEEVYYAAGSIIKVGNKDIRLFKEKADNNKRQRSRLCTHKDINDKLQEMFIVHKKGTYVRPHKHLNKSEGAHILEGSAYFIVFDGKGNIREITEIGNYSSGKKFYYRISGPYYHSLFITSDYLVFHETTSGPFVRTDTVFPPWAPDDKDKDAAKKFMENLKRKIDQEKSD